MPMCAGKCSEGERQHVKKYNFSFIITYCLVLVCCMLTTEINNVAGLLTVILTSLH